MSKFSILMFDGKMDFTVWKMTIEDVLVQQGIDEALEEKQPAEMKDDVWKTMQKKASSTIRLALAPEIKYSVLKEKTPKDIWDKLTNIYASKSLTHRLFLKMELYSLKLEEGSNLHDHINSFNQLVCQLANVDDAIKDEEQALLMLSSLPKSYKPFVQTMLTGRTTLTFEDVLKALRDNERMTGNDSSSSSDKLLLADDSGRGRNFQRGSSKGRSKSRMGGDRDMSVVECYYCGDKGHMQVRCPQFLDNGGDEFLMTETPMDGILREEKPKWVLDNAASSHICNDRAMFETLNGKGQFGEIKVGSKQMMKIEGVGSPRFEKKESYNLEEAITRRTKSLCLVRHILHSGGRIDIVESYRASKFLPKSMFDRFFEEQFFVGFFTAIGLCVLDCYFKKMASDMSKLSIPMFDGKMDFTYLLWKIDDEDSVVSTSVVECYYYGDTGHMQVRCPQFREDLKCLRDSKGKRKVDGGEMNVMCYVETLNGKGQFGEIKVGSKQMMKIEGVGSVRFKLHDGSVKTALNVKYVPGAARNILSLGESFCKEDFFCGGNKGKKKIEKRVHFSDKDEVLGILKEYDNRTVFSDDVEDDEDYGHDGHNSSSSGVMLH
ncbi:retrovirus-related pol polyprotein from transposon TNT 1-94 [Tanacetum coccineum]